VYIIKEEKVKIKRARESCWKSKEEREEEGITRSRASFFKNITA